MALAALIGIFFNLYILGTRKVNAHMVACTHAGCLKNSTGYTLFMCYNSISTNFPVIAALAHQPKFEAVLSEVDIVINEIHYAINNLSSWMKPEYASTNLVGLMMIC